MDNMTVRKNLGKKKSRTWIDMEKVYRMIDSGMTVKQAEYMNDDLPDLPT